MSELKSLTLNGTKYDCFVDSVARENGNGSAASLSTKQINALDALFKSASYTEDVSAKYAAFREAFGLDKPEVEVTEETIDFDDVRIGTVSFYSNGGMNISYYDNRATLVPIGIYLEKGKTYTFSLGNISDKYSFGVQTFAAESAGLTFPYSSAGTHYYEGVTERIVDSGWKNADYTHTPDRDNCILAVNFKLKTDATLEESNLAEILENFTIKKKL